MTYKYQLNRIFNSNFDKVDFRNMNPYIAMIIFVGHRTPTHLQKEYTEQKNIMSVRGIIWTPPL